VLASIRKRFNRFRASPEYASEISKITIQSAAVQGRLGIVPELAVSMLCVAWLWDSVPKSALVIWITLYLPLLYLFFLGAPIPSSRIQRWMSHYNWRQNDYHNASLQQIRKWTRYFTLALTLGALRWGLGGAFALAFATPVQQLLIPFVVVGVGLASASTLSLYLPAFYLYETVNFAPIIVRLGMSGDATQWTLCGMAIVAFGAVLIAGRRYATLYQNNLHTLAALKHERDKAELATQAKSRFLAMASHDLRQPIYALGLFVDALKRQIRAPEVVQLVDRIETSVHFMETMFNDLLDLSKLSAGAIEVDRRSVPLVDVFKEIELQFASTARARDLDFRIRWTDVTVESDPKLLRQIIRNFVSNGIRYTTKGGVLLAARKIGNGKMVRVEVWDTGRGIPQDKQQEVFSEFFRLNDKNHIDDRGLGIGLTIAQRATALLGHSLTVQSKLGIGSCFSLNVPIANEVSVFPTIVANTGISDRIKGPFVLNVPMANGINAFPTIAGSAGTSDRLKGAFVLVVDDDKTVVEGTRLLLQSRGSHVICGSNANEAMAKLAEHERFVDLIITDYDLAGGTTGLDLVARIHREVCEDIPVLIVTGTSKASEVREKIDYQFLQKPVSASRLVEAANALLNKHCISS